VYDGAVRPNADSAASGRFDQLARQARESISQGHIADAKKSLSEMRATCFDEARKQPSFVVNMFLDLVREKHFAIDKSVHDKLVEVGKTCIDRQDINGLRAVIAQMLENRYPTTASESAAMTLAGLMKW
jgi:hypothetical protein